jgi:hypothetical protein
MDGALEQYHRAMAIQEEKSPFSWTLPLPTKIWA